MRDQKMNAVKCVWKFHNEAFCSSQCNIFSATSALPLKSAPLYSIIRNYKAIEGKMMYFHKKKKRITFSRSLWRMNHTSWTSPMGNLAYFMNSAYYMNFAYFMNFALPIIWTSLCLIYEFLLWTSIMNFY